MGCYPHRPWRARRGKRQPSGAAAASARRKRLPSPRGRPREGRGSSGPVPAFHLGRCRPSGLRGPTRRPTARGPSTCMAGKARPSLPCPALVCLPPLASQNGPPSGNGAVPPAFLRWGSRTQPLGLPRPRRPLRPTRRAAARPNLEGDAAQGLAIDGDVKEHGRVDHGWAAREVPGWRRLQSSEEQTFKYW